jgi:Uma2 family endonuclease
MTVAEFLPEVQQRIAMPTEPVWRLSVEDYHQMIRAGILTDDDPIELLEGLLVPKMTKHRPHTITTWLTRQAIASLVPDGWYVDSQEPITTMDSEPEPDVVVVRGAIGQYPDPPAPQNVALVVEVADSTLQRDRTVKKRLYARAGIACYWIVNLLDQNIEVYTQPTGTGDKATYTQRALYGLMDDVPMMIDGVEVGRLSAQTLWGK